MRPYKSNIPKEAVFSFGFGMLVFFGGSALLHRRGDSTGALGLFTVGLLSTYLLLGYRNKLRISTDGEGLYILDRSVLLPLATPEAQKVPFDDIQAFKIERGPRSNYGPQVHGETVAVLTTTAGEIRIFSRWLTHAAYRELCDLIRSKIPEKLG